MFFEMILKREPEPMASCAAGIAASVPFEGRSSLGRHCSGFEPRLGEHRLHHLAAHA